MTESQEKILERIAVALEKHNADRDLFDKNITELVTLLKMFLAAIGGSVTVGVDDRINQGHDS